VEVERLRQRVPQLYALPPPWPFGQVGPSARDHPVPVSAKPNAPLRSGQALSTDETSNPLPAEMVYLGDAPTLSHTSPYANLAMMSTCRCSDLPSDHPRRSAYTQTAA
jgi:hypothetical protein